MKRTIFILCMALILLAGAAVPGFAAGVGSWFSKGGSARGSDGPAPMGSSEKQSSSIREQVALAGGSLLQIQMSGWALVKDGPMSLSALEELAREVRETWGGAAQKAEIRPDETDSMRQVVLSLERDGDCAILTFHSGDQTFLAADAVTRDVWDERKEKVVFSAMERLLKRFESGSCVRTTYTSVLPGKLDTERMEQIAGQIFRGLDGEMEEEIRDAGWISRTGYSNRIPCALHSGGKRINLNVALRYNDYEGRTYLWLGTPVISIPY